MVEEGFEERSVAAEDDSNDETRQADCGECKG